MVTKTICVVVPLFTTKCILLPNIMYILLLTIDCITHKFSLKHNSKECITPSATKTYHLHCLNIAPVKVNRVNEKPQSNSIIDHGQNTLFHLVPCVFAVMIVGAIKPLNIYLLYYFDYRHILSFKQTINHDIY